MNRFARLSLVAVCALAGGSTVIAQEGAPPSADQVAEQATLTRQGLFKVMSWSFTGPVGGMLRNKVPFDAAIAGKSAERVKELSALIPELFQSDTRKFTVKTKAKENIWSNQADFAAKADDLGKAAAALEDAAKTGDKGATMKAAGAVGKACGACHDNYREK
jgi:cytochrome c556